MFNSEYGTWQENQVAKKCETECDSNSIAKIPIDTRNKIIDRKSPDMVPGAGNKYECENLQFLSTSRIKKVTDKIGKKQNINSEHPEHDKNSPEYVRGFFAFILSTVFIHAGDDTRHF